MSIIPNSVDERIAFSNAHAIAWAPNVDDLGIEAGEVVNLITLTSTALNARTAATDAFATAHRATIDQNVALEAMTEKLSTLITQIKGYAADQAAPESVYALADLPLTEEPSPEGAPGSPEDLAGTITDDGDVELTWSAPSGGFGSNVSFTIERRFFEIDTSQTSWVAIGNVGEMTYLDRTVPMGFAAVSYRVKAWFGDDASDASDPIVILLGSNAGAILETVLSAHEGMGDAA